MGRNGRFFRSVRPRGGQYVFEVIARTGKLPYLPRWLLFGLVAGPAVGLVAVAVHELADFVTAALAGIGTRQAGPPTAAGFWSGLEPGRAWTTPVAVAVGALLAGLIAARAPAGTARAGIDAAVHAANTSPTMIRLPGSATRAGTAVIVVGSGGSGGIVGPAGHVSAAITAAVSRAFGLRPADARVAIAAGLAATIGSIMEAPLAGAVFAAELLVLRGMTTSALPPAVFCSAVAFGVSSALGGSAPVFAEGLPVDRLAAAPDRPVTYAAMILVGVAAGAAGKAYALFLHSTGEWFSRRRTAPAVKLAVAGLAVGTAGLFVPGVAGAGYTLVDQAAVSSRLVGESLAVVLLTPLVKIACTSLTLGSGAPAGTFGPGLVVGASVGAACWQLCAPLGVAPESPTLFVLAGAVAGIGSISHAPVAAVVLAGEITGGLACVPAVVLAVVAAVVVVGDTTLFRSQLDGPDGACSLSGGRRARPR